MKMPNVYEERRVKEWRRLLDPCEYEALPKSYDSTFDIEHEQEYPSLFPKVLEHVYEGLLCQV